MLVLLIEEDYEARRCEGLTCLDLLVLCGILLRGYTAFYSCFQNKDSRLVLKRIHESRRARGRGLEIRLQHEEAVGLMIHDVFPTSSEFSELLGFWTSSIVRNLKSRKHNVSETESATILG
jgi:hypothetical protein